MSVGFSLSQLECAEHARVLIQRVLNVLFTLPVQHGRIPGRYPYTAATVRWTASHSAMGPMKHAPESLRTKLQPASSFYDGVEEGSLCTQSGSAPSSNWPMTRRHRCRLSGSLAMVLILLYTVVFLLISPVDLLRASNRDHITDLRTPNHSFESQKSWGQYSPFFSVERYQDPPTHCTVIQVRASYP
jgi:hypothetical protein